MKRLFMSVLSLMLAVTIAVPSLGTPAEAAKAKEISVVIDGVKQYYDPAPVVVNGRTLVPMRAIFEKLGMIIEWDAKTSTVRGYTMSDDLKLTIYSKWAFLNDQAVALDVPAQLVKGRTMVPIRFVGEAMGAQVAWNEATSTVTIKSAHAINEGGYMRDLMKSENFRESYAQLETNFHKVNELYRSWHEDSATPGTSWYIAPGAMRQKLLAQLQEAEDLYNYMKSVEAYDQDLKYLLERYDQMINLFLYALDNDSEETNNMTVKEFQQVSDMFTALNYRDAGILDNENAGSCDSPFCWWDGYGQDDDWMDDLNPDFDPNEDDYGSNPYNPDNPYYDPYDPYNPYPGNVGVPGNDSVLDPLYGTYDPYEPHVPSLPQGVRCDADSPYPGYYSSDGTFVPRYSGSPLCAWQYYDEHSFEEYGVLYTSANDPMFPQTLPSTAGWSSYENDRYAFSIRHPWGAGVRSANGDGMSWAKDGANIRVYSRRYVESDWHQELQDHAAQIQLPDRFYGNLMIKYDGTTCTYTLQTRFDGDEYIFTADVKRAQMQRYHGEIMAAIYSFQLH